MAWHGFAMAIELNHTIVAAVDAEVSAHWLADLFDLSPVEAMLPFWQVTTANDVGLDFVSVPDGAEIASQHYAFLVADNEFDRIYDKLVSRGIDYWADPARTRHGEINTNDGGRGAYFASPDGHLLEIITVPYGG